MSGVRLVAEREVRERLRARSFRVATLLLAAGIAASIALPTVLDDGAKTYKAVVAPSVDTEAEKALELVMAGERYRTTVVSSAAARRAAVQHGDADFAVAPDGTVLIKKAADPARPSRTALVASALARQVAVQRELGRADIPDSLASELANPTAGRVAAIEPVEADKAARRRTAIGASFVLYVLLMTYGTWVLYGVIEERTSRVVEVLLATLRPSQLLAGKMLGIGTVALGQALLLAAIAMGASALVGQPLPRFGALEIAATIGWLLAGYVFYSTLYAAAGTLASRHEEASNVAFPVSALLIGAYMCAIASADSDGNVLLTAASMFPPFTPLVMPVRLAAQEVPAWQPAVAVALMAAAVLGVTRVAALVYARGALRAGGRVRYRDALKPAA